MPIVGVTPRGEKVGVTSVLGRQLTLEVTPGGPGLPRRAPGPACALWTVSVRGCQWGQEPRSPPRLSEPQGAGVATSRPLPFPLGFLDRVLKTARDGVVHVLKTNSRTCFCRHPSKWVVSLNFLQWLHRGQAGGEGGGGAQKTLGCLPPPIRYVDL